MRIKEIPRTVYDRVYVAKDGREFKSMEECEAYEITIDDINKENIEDETIEKMKDAIVEVFGNKDILLKYQNKPILHR